MLDMKAHAALIITICAIAGCQDRSAPPDTSPPGISYRLSGSDMSTTNRQADAYCRQYGKRAVLDKVSPTGNDSVASYECR
jgi:hypothetical protein